MSNIVRYLILRVAALCAVLGVGAWTATTPAPQSPSWHLVKDWPRVHEGTLIGQVSGVDLDTAGHVMIFARAGGTFDRTAKDPRPTPTVFELDPASGRVLNSWGANLFVLPHSITVDRNNNVWLTDDVRHQAMQFTHDGRFLRAVGQERTPGWDATHFNEPTDVGMAGDGSFYVSDGYQNARIAHFRPDGSFLHEWGTKGKEPGQFTIPHGLALDAQGNVYVADRQNGRLQMFDKSGSLLRVWTAEAGRVFDVAVTAKAIYIAISNNTKPHEVRILDREWRDVGSASVDSTQLTSPHQIAVQGDSVIYVADTNGERILKFSRVR